MGAGHGDGRKQGASSNLTPSESLSERATCAGSRLMKPMRTGYYINATQNQMR